MDGGERLHRGWFISGVVALLVACAAGLTVGQVDIALLGVVKELADHLPWVTVDSGLSDLQANIVWDLRAPRVAAGVIVGSMLSLGGASYQAVFRNPLADPYLLGAAAGAGLGVTVAIINNLAIGGYDLTPVLAFAGAIGAVAITWFVGAIGDRNNSTASLLLAGVAVTAFITALQTYIQQRNVETIREVYSWILGSLTGRSWDDVLLVLPYVLPVILVVLAHRRVLDVMAVGDEEAETLGVRPARVRAIVVIAATLGTAAAVAVGGLVSFVGLIVPHTVRLLTGPSNRNVLPLSLLFGAAFIVAVDLLARTVINQVEVPLSVITAVLGGPFFIYILRTNRARLT